MKALGLILLFLYFNKVKARDHELVCRNVTLDATVRQLLEFKMKHPNPIGLLTTEAGGPVEIRDINLLNTDLFSKTFFFDFMSHFSSNRIPERNVHAKGVTARGYFEVTNDVSKYTKADVFNGVGKRTPVLARFSHSNEERGGTDLGQELRGVAIKFFTNEGNLDFLNLQIPIFFTKQPLDFLSDSHIVALRNPKTMDTDNDARWDLVTLRPWILHELFYLLSDYGIPDGFRKMDLFTIHTYELNSKNGGRYFVRFNFRTQQGVAFLTQDQAAAIQATDLDYFIRDLYNAIADKNYPSWILEMQVMSFHDVQHLDYDPFDMTRLWKNGTFETVRIGRLVLDQMSDNQYRDSETSAFNPANLVPGIPGPMDVIFQARRFAYKDAQNYRLGRNHDKTDVNRPLYVKNYNRDGEPPVRDNMKDAPNYYPNTFNGPIPFVDESKPKELITLMQSNSVDLQHPADFYNNILTQPQRERLVQNIVTTLQRVKSKNILYRALRLLYLTDPDLGRRVEIAYNLAGSCVQ